jgi:hypothetical protein
MLLKINTLHMHFQVRGEDRQLLSRNDTSTLLLSLRNGVIRGGGKRIRIGGRRRVCFGERRGTFGRFFAEGGWGGG